MKVFTIDAADHVTAFASVTAAKKSGSELQFKNAEGLAELTVEWPMSRLVAIWNQMAGVTPVKKFKDRGTGVARIWKALQEEAVVEPVEEPDADVNPEVESGPALLIDAVEPEVAPEPEAESTPVAEPTATPEAAQAPDVAPEEVPAAAKAAREPKGSHQGSKTANVLDLMQREGGATLAEIMEATGWQAHSVRGFISGTIAKKMGRTVLSVKGEGGVRHYSIQA